MENKHKIIIVVLIVIIAALLIGMGILMSEMNKQDSILKIPDKKVNVGNPIVFILTDSNGNPISNQTVNIKIIDKKGNTIDKNLKTNSKGTAKFKMEEKGKYSVECNYEGNDKYKSSSVAANITVKKPTTTLVNEEKSNDFNSVSGLSGDGYSYYPENGPNVDSRGVTKQEAISKNWHYIPQTIDGMDAGIYVPYDSKAGCYHT